MPVDMGPNHKSRDLGFELRTEDPDRCVSCFCVASVGAVGCDCTRMLWKYSDIGKCVCGCPENALLGNLPAPNLERLCSPLVMRTLLAIIASWGLRKKRISPKLNPKP